MNDPYRLRRFENAQNQGTYEAAVTELRAGRKASHWMWFIFPQIAGLGHSSMSRTYAISSLSEAEAYLTHPVLGPRLIECARILTGLTGRTAEEIFGATDAMKLRSSMTLFARAPHRITRGFSKSWTITSMESRTSPPSVGSMLGTPPDSQERTRSASNPRRRRSRRRRGLKPVSDLPTPDAAAPTAPPAGGRRTHRARDR